MSTSPASLVCGLHGLPSKELVSARPPKSKYLNLLDKLLDGAGFSSVYKRLHLQRQSPMTEAVSRYSTASVSAYLHRRCLYARRSACDQVKKVKALSLSVSFAQHHSGLVQEAPIPLCNTAALAAGLRALCLEILLTFDVLVDDVLHDAKLTQSWLLLQ